MSTPTPQPPFGQPAPGGWGAQPLVTPPATKSSRRKAWLTHGAVALIALGLGAGIGGAGKGNAQAAGPAPAATVTATTAAPTPSAITASPKAETTKPTTTPPPSKPAAPKAAPPPKVAGDGEYLVGQDMKAGTYKTAGSTDGLCYWERDKDSSGEFSSIIANGSPSGTGRVTVKKGEVFKSQGCDDWVKVG